VVLGVHDGCLDVLHPYSRRPVAHREEEFGVGRVSLNRVDGTVVLARALIEHGNAIVLLPVLEVDKQHHALLGAHQVLGRSRLGVVLE
jgi:hypothetical protein